MAHLFGHARVLFVAKLFAFERGLQQGTFYSLIWFGDSWGKCFSATLLIGGLAFFIIIIGSVPVLNSLDDDDDDDLFDDLGYILFLVFGGLMIVVAGWWLSKKHSCGGRINLFCPSALQ
jgi:hypothetical protein